MELAIDTSSNTTSIALSEGGCLMASLTWQTSRNHTVELLPNLICLLQQVGVELGSMLAIIVARGPGSFNGLRVGVSTAKGLAFALNIPLVGIDTSEAEAYDFAFTGLPLRPIYKAGREQVATALYRQIGDEWQHLEEPNLSTLTDLWPRIKEKTLFCGEIPSGMMKEIQRTLGKQAIVSHSISPCRSTALAALGWRKLTRGERDDPITLQPLYLRPPHITNPRDKRPPFATVSKSSETKNGNSQTRC
ncbi:MAG: tRNA (adenosine(37)-N6)-threonylcarbamoyltransferase complex dimerization subunit type 1 TsaB [Dehalococcoidia bacterium]